MPTITPFVPTPEEIAEYERLQARSTPPAGNATHTHTTPPVPAAPQGPTHTHGTGVPAPAYHAYPGTAPAQPVPGQPQQQPPPRPPLAQFILTAEQLEALDIPPRPALLDQWLCEGDLGYIYAPRGVGKTWLAMALPGAISCRRPLGLWAAGEEAPSSEAPAAVSAPGNEAAPATAPEQEQDPATAPAPAPASAPEAATPPPPAPGHIPVLYVDGEMALRHSKCRARGLDLSKVHHLHHEHLFNQSGSAVNIGEPEDRQRLTNALIEQGYRVLIMDNLSSLASGIDENKGMDYEPLASWLLDLRRRKITVIVIHHAGRNGFMRGHSKREDACSWIIELRDARQESDPGAKFVSHFAKPSRNTGDPLPDLLWHFTTDKATGITNIHCELAINSEYDQFIQHVMEGVTSQKDIAELMNRHKGTVSKWARKALEEGRLSGNTHKLLPPRSSQSTPVKSHYHPDEDNDDEEEDDRV